MEEKVINILKSHGVNFIQEWEQTSYGVTELIFQFYGSEFDLIQVYDLLLLYGFNMSSAKRSYTKEDVHKNGDDINGEIIGSNWVVPVNEIAIYSD